MAWHFIFGGLKDGDRFVNKIPRGAHSLEGRTRSVEEVHNMGLLIYCWTMMREIAYDSADSWLIENQDQQLRFPINFVRMTSSSLIRLSTARIFVPHTSPLSRLLSHYAQEKRISLELKLLHRIQRIARDRVKKQTFMRHSLLDNVAFALAARLIHCVRLTCIHPLRFGVSFASRNAAPKKINANDS